MPSENNHFWNIRADKYDNLFWVKDTEYLDAIIDKGNFNTDQIVLDVGTGTGVVANRLKKHVKHVVAVDISNSMLHKGTWTGVSIVNWDIGNALFANGLFDRVVARMVFHHIHDNLDRAILRCYDLLKDDGQIIIAEGIPPSSDKRVVNWYTEMFKLKETRRTFSQEKLRYFLEKNGFINVQTHIYIMDRFNVNNWLINSGLPQDKIDKILQIHIQAADVIKEAYNMQVVNGECYIRTVNVIMCGHK